MVVEVPALQDHPKGKVPFSAAGRLAGAVRVVKYLLTIFSPTGPMARSLPALLLLVISVGTGISLAQSTIGTLEDQVTNPSGAAIPGAARQRPSTGVRILGTQYSSRLVALISRIEQSTGRKIIFKAKVGEQSDNSIIRDGDTFVINLGPGSVEDDVAHELMHAQLESEGYPHLFCLAAIPVAKVIETFISSDFDHLIINQRLLKEGYNPLLGFMSGMKDQYKSVMTVRLPPNPTPEQRVAFDVLMLHELMKHVYYVRSAAAETAILGSHPEIRPRWAPLKSAIEQYIGNPDFRHAWKFAETYLKLMDGITMANAPTPGFSEMFGLGPLPVSFRQKTAAASALLRVSQAPNDPHAIVRVFHGNVMVGAVAKAGEPEEDLRQPLSVFAARYGIALYPR